MSAVRHVAIVGADIGGLACALACAQAGARVDLLPGAQDLPPALPPTPSGIDIVPNSLRDLHRLGVAEPCVREGFPYHGTSVVDTAGRQLSMAATPGLAGPRLPAAVGITAGRLQQVLRASVQAAGVHVGSHRTLASVEADRGIAMWAEGGSTAADLVVLCTGDLPAAVDEVFGPAQVTDEQRTWCHTMIARPPRLDRPTWMAGRDGTRLRVLPVSSRQAELVVGLQPHEQAPATAAELSALLGSWGAFPRGLAACLSKDASVIQRSSTSSLRTQPWAQGAVLVAGTAARSATSPLGQWVAQALEDAVVLGELLAASTERRELLVQYDARRRARSRRVHALTGQATRWLTRPESATDLAAIADQLAALLTTPA